MCWTQSMEVCCSQHDHEEVYPRTEQVLCWSATWRPTFHSCGLAKVASKRWYFFHQQAVAFWKKSTGIWDAESTLVVQNNVVPFVHIFILKGFNKFACLERFHVLNVSQIILFYLLSVIIQTVKCDLYFWTIKRLSELTRLSLGNTFLGSLS